MLIGEGEEKVEYWYYGFDDIVESLDSYINQASEHDFIVDWYTLKKDDPSALVLDPNFKPDNSLCGYDLIDGLDVDYEDWDQNSPGANGSYITITAKQANIEKIKESATVLLNNLKKYWQQQGFNVILLDKENDELRKENSDQRESINALTKKLGKEKKQIGVSKEEKQGRKELLALIIKVISYLNSPKKLFFCSGPILITRQKTIYVITNHNVYYQQQGYDELLSVLAKSKFKIDKVVEYSLDGSYLPHIGYLLSISMPSKYDGWNQKDTILKGLNKEDHEANHIRAEYLDWLNSKGSKLKT